MNKYIDRWFKPAVIILGILIVLGLFGNIYLLLRKETQEPIVSKITPAPTQVTVLPTPTLNPTVNWQRHDFPKMGFSVALPARWYPHGENISSGGGSYESWISYPVDNPSPQAPLVEGLVANISLSTFESPDSLDQDANIRLTEPGHIEPKPQKLDSKLDGERSIILKSPKVIQVLSDHNGKRFLLQLGTDDPSLAQVFDQILSTFKFLD